MSNTIRIKRRASGSPGAPSSLQNAELAYNEVDNILYYGKGSGGSGGSATTVEAIGGPGAYVTLVGDVSVSGTKTFSGLRTAVAPSIGTDVTNKTYVDNSLSAKANLNSPTFTGTVGGISAAMVGLGNVDNTSDLSKPVSTATQSALNLKANLNSPTFTGTVTAATITGLNAPVNPSDAATKAYVDAARSGLDVKESVLAATSNPITLSLPAGAPAALIDGITCWVGSRILVKNQTNPAENGIYIITDAPTNWVRSNDANSTLNISSGMFTFVEQGSNNGGTGFVLTTPNSEIISIGTSALNFTPFSGTASIEVSYGLANINGGTGNIIQIDPSVVATLSDAQTFTGSKTFSSAISGSITGNASTATSLQNSRTLTVGNSGKAFDGSSNVSWSLSEIGAAATSQTFFIGTTSVTIDRASGPLALSGCSLDGGTF